MPSTRYIAYIDEAGDFGLRSIAPIDRNGASEWFVLSAVLVAVDNEAEVPRWLFGLRDAAHNLQPASLHFRKLSNGQKDTVCLGLAGLPVRLFTVISNKRNMRNHANQRAARVSGTKHWFYWWCSRLLLERVTVYCAARNQRHNHSGRLRVEFSCRTDLRYDQFKDYFTRIWAQDRPTLDKRMIDWSVFNFDGVTFHDHGSRAGLQLADIVASAFYQAVNIHPQGACDSSFAEVLRPRVWQDGGSYIDAGFSVMPTSLRNVPLTDAQKCVFRAYGFPEARLSKAAARGLSSAG